MTNQIGGTELADMKAMQKQAIRFQTQMNISSMEFNLKMAAKDAEKKAWDKVHG